MRLKRQLAVTGAKNAKKMNAGGWRCGDACSLR
jgi:hypothetical protein